MASYTVHLPKGVGLDQIDAEALNKAVLIKDGFSRSAFLFSVFWFLWNRLWIAALAVLAATITLDAVFDVFHVNHFFASVAGVLLMTLIGLEANSLKRWTFTRNGRPAVAVLTGEDEAEAEAKMVVLGLKHRRSHRHPMPSVPPTTKPFSASDAPAPALGLFPLSERPR